VADRVCIGRIGGAHGVRGWFKVSSYTAEPMDVAAYGPVSNEDGTRMFELEAIRMARSHVIARIAGVSDRNAAETLRGIRLFVSRDVLPPAGEDEFYWEDLTGLAVETIDGEALGPVLSIQEFGAGVMLEVGMKTGPSVMVPFTGDIVPVVDTSAGRIVIDPPPGLLTGPGKEDE
jgi:16S rRNA processing protein RimM